MRYIEERWNLSKSYKHFNTIFKYSDFETKLSRSIVAIDKDLIWKLKYLILVLIRYNAMSPLEVPNLLAFIEETMEHFGIHLYILWQRVSQL